MRTTPFSRAVLATAAAIWMCVLQAYSQTTPDQLEIALKGKRFALRNFSADQTVKAKWISDALAFDPPTLSTFGVFAPGSVKLKGTMLTIAGTRSIVLLDGKTGKPGVSDGSPAWLQIDLGTADPATVLPGLQAALFFPDLDSAANAIPVQFRDLVPYRLNPSDPRKPSENPQAKDHWFLVEGSWKKLPIGSPKAIPPKLLHGEGPEYTEQARQLKVQGSVILALMVSETGSVETVWLLKPFGYGMDEAAAVAAAKTTFTPAQVEGKSAAMSLIYDVNFQIFNDR